MLGRSPAKDSTRWKVFPWASYKIYTIAGCACVGNAGEVFPAIDLKGYRDPGTHHGTCVTHVPWCMSGSLTRGGWENVAGIPGACATRNFTYLTRGPYHDIITCQTPHISPWIQASSKQASTINANWWWRFVLKLNWPSVLVFISLNIIRRFQDVCSITAINGS